MLGMNKVQLIGNIGNDVELRYTQGGTAVCNCSLATNERWVNKEGKRQEKVEWHRLVVWGKLAEVFGEWVKKGDAIYVEGKLQTRQYEDREGVKRFTTEINVLQMLMLGGKRDAEAQPARESRPEGASHEMGPEEELPF